MDPAPWTAAREDSYQKTTSSWQEMVSIFGLPGLVLSVTKTAGMRTNETEVLVVGAGPAGMMTALLLAEAGIRVEIIDQAWRTAAHSYACVLHSGALRLLARLNLLEEFMDHARSIKTVGFYDGQFRRAELNLCEITSDLPCAVTAPQSSLESLLEERLTQRGDVPVHWNHRLADLQLEEQGAVALIEQLSRRAKGHIVPDRDWEVEKTWETRSAFVVGADGHRSLVRDRLGIEYERVGEDEIFNVFEFETQNEPAGEGRVVLDDRTTNVLWPLPGNRWRWSFQFVSPNCEAEHLDKERQSLWLVQEDIDQETRSRIRQLAKDRAPWFRGRVQDIDWSVRIRFEGRLAKQFGHGRCWLIGDAAHQTGPVGGQSMNAGLCEAEDLADKLKLVLRAGSAPELLESYGAMQRARWQTLLGLSGQWNAGATAAPWVQERCARIVPCIPAAGDDLAQLARQAGIAFHRHDRKGPGKNAEANRHHPLARRQRDEGVN
jgi:2-polyprenyl-6-methoxyphenol hydroxylase-like FAD-dependent oxidoreductase